MIIALSILLACGGDASESDTDANGEGTLQNDPRTDASTWVDTLAADSERPADVMYPSNYDGESLLPLIMILHGYGANGMVQEIYFQLSPQIDDRGFIYIIPDGTTDQGGSPFWNATPGCCNFYGSDVDDSGYLRGLIDEAESIFPVDPDRITITGHSNGGFMSYRMACDHADKVAGIASLAGSTFGNEADCAASEPVSVLQIHGDEDDTIPYDGTIYYPSAPETVQRWADRDGCSATESSTIELTSSVDGEETDVLTYTDCDTVNVGLWTVNGTGHVPAFGATYATELLDWLLAQHK